MAFKIVVFRFLFREFFSFSFLLITIKQFYSFHTQGKDGRDGRDGINAGNGMKVKILKTNNVFSAITKSMINYFWEQRWISQRRTFKNTQVPCNPRFHLLLKNPLFSVGKGNWHSTTLVCSHKLVSKDKKFRLKSQRQRPVLSKRITKKEIWVFRLP